MGDALETLARTDRCLTMKDLSHVIKPSASARRPPFSARRNNEYVFEVHREANKLEIKQAVAAALRQEGRRRPHRELRRQAQAPRRADRRPHQPLEEGRRPPQGGREDRPRLSALTGFDPAQLLHPTRHGSQNIQAHTPRRTATSSSRPSTKSPSTSRRRACSSPLQEERRPQQHRPHHLPSHRRRPQAPYRLDRLQARPAATRPPAWSASSTIRTAPRASRSSSIADGQKSYILAPANLAVGAKVMAGEKAQPEVGNALPLSSDPARHRRSTTSSSTPGQGRPDRPRRRPGRHPLQPRRRLRPGEDALR